MTRLIRVVIAGAFAASLAACAAQPRADLTAPAKKCVDAKTQLETGRNC